MNNIQFTIYQRCLTLLFIVYCLLFIGVPLGAQAQSVDLLWHGETYTPPFYKGLALWSRQSRITLVVMPDGLGNRANLDYKWSRNGVVLGNLSGIGKNIISYSDSVLSRAQTFRVDIISSDEDVLASASLTLTPTSPQPLVYENNPLYGLMFHRAVDGTYPLKEQEITFTAFPFFFSTFNRVDKTMAYEWRTNAGEAELNNSVTYRVPENTKGSSEVRVWISNKDKILQSANNNFLVQFGGKN